MTRVTRPTFKTSTTTLYPSSGAGAISAADLRAQTDNIADSVGFVYVNTTNPAASDDIGDGYVPGDIWVNTTSDTDYICVNNAAGAAVWSTKQPLDAVLTNTTASFTTAQETKLGGVEALADVTDAANVTAAGAVMDSEVTNLAAVKSFDPADYLASNPAWSTITATPTTLAGYGITNGQPLDAVLTNTTASFTTAQETKLGGVEALADVTDTANVTAAGAALTANNLSDLASAASALTNLGLTATAAELNFVDGVTSAIQTQLNGKQATITVGTTEPGSPTTGQLWVDTN